MTTEGLDCGLQTRGLVVLVVFWHDHCSQEMSSWRQGAPDLICSIMFAILGADIGPKAVPKAL